MDMAVSSHGLTGFGMGCVSTHSDVYSERCGPSSGTVRGFADYIPSRRSATLVSSTTVGSLSDSPASVPRPVPSAGCSEPVIRTPGNGALGAKNARKNARRHRLIG